MSTVNGFQVGSETLKYNYESLDNYNTPNFSTSSSTTYSVGDYVMYNGKLYKCTTATTGGTWVSGSWTEAVLSDDVNDLFRQLNKIENSVVGEPTTYNTENQYYQRINELAVGKTYRIGISVQTAGTYTIHLTTDGNLSAAVDAIFDNQSFEANTPKSVLYTVEDAGIIYLRCSSNAVTWSATISELLELSDFQTDIETNVNNISTLSEGADLSYEILNTSQLFPRTEEPGTLYILNGTVISNAEISRSWIIPVETNKRYVSYVTQTLLDNDRFVIYTTEEMPVVGTQLIRSEIAIQHSAGTKEFVTAQNENYLLVMLNGNVANVNDDIPYYGIEQIDEGTSYQNEEYGKYSHIKGVVTADSISDETAQEIVEKANIQPHNKWEGKRIWWCGTSIPYGKDQALGSEGSGLSYPEMVGELLGATVYNEAEGSSMARANVRTGDYVNAMSYNLLLSLSQTLEEKQYIINNWSTIRTELIDPNTMETLTQTWQTYAVNASFEKRLMPYLDGTKPMPDLFVFDHGHNDWKSYYTMPDNTTPDTELKPTVDNITNNILAEDSFMTANNNAKLISFFGEVSAIPQASLSSFIASVNRNCFIGAINFLCTLILSKNPRARIVFIGNLDNWEKPQVQPAQEFIANSWEFPIIKMWEYLGMSDHYIPNSATFWSSSGTTDLTMKQIYCKDSVHPHSDTTGVTLELYSETIANALRNIV